MAKISTVGRKMVKYLLLPVPNDVKYDRSIDMQGEGKNDRGQVHVNTISCIFVQLNSEMVFFHSSTSMKFPTTEKHYVTN